MPKPDGDPRGERERWLDVSLFWREPMLWPVAFCAVVGAAALLAGAVSMALTNRNPLARGALAVAALMTAFALYEQRRAKGRFGAGAVIAAIVWTLSIGGGFALANLGD